MHNMTNEEIYNLACGVVGIAHYDTKEEFEVDFQELNSNKDFTYLGEFEMTQDIDFELEEQGFTLDDITKMSLNQYGRVLEVLSLNSEYTYHAFIGQR